MTTVTSLLVYCPLLCFVFGSWLPWTSAFSNHGQIRSFGKTQQLSTTHSENYLSKSNDEIDQQPETSPRNQATITSRRSVVTSLGVLVGATTSSSFLSTFRPAAAAAAEEGSPAESFESIAARANKISKELESATPTYEIRKTDKTMYDFELPVEGTSKPIMEIIRQQFSAGDSAKVKAILVVNIKQDDPVARKDIPELISLVTKYGRTGEFVVILCPTDQGYFEPDTSALIRLKLASEYGFGINPASVVTDKVNLLGTGAHPFWRWLEGTCRTPAGLGRVQGNFEKFLLDGRTGLPLRRYPRKYMPLDIRDDIEYVLAGRPLPPAGANWLEEWRAATAEAERDTYRFEKGLNVFDQ